MQGKVPDGSQALFLELFERPEENYPGFAETVKKAVDTKHICTVTTVLETLNDVFAGQCEVTEDQAKVALEKFITQGFLEMMFVSVICLPITAEVNKTLVALIETLCLVSEKSVTAKSRVSIFMPYLLRDIVGNGDHSFRTRIDAAKFLNGKFEEHDPKTLQQIEEIKEQKTVRDDMGVLISSAGDFELQAAMLEMVFRLIQHPERDAFVPLWFPDTEVQEMFCSIEDAAFEGGCRNFLNKLNESIGTQRSVYSLPCLAVKVGDKQVRLAKDDTLDDFWMDFNLGSKTIKFFVEEQDGESTEDGESLWETVTIKSEDIWNHRVEEEHHGVVLSLTFKDPDYRLVTNLLPCGQRNVHISFPKTCNVLLIRQLLRKISVASPSENRQPYTPSPKASVAIHAIHVGSRQKGLTKIVPTVTANLPKVIMAGDIVEQESEPDAVGLSNNRNNSNNLGNKAVDEEVRNATKAADNDQQDDGDVSSLEFPIPDSRITTRRRGSQIEPSTANSSLEPLDSDVSQPSGRSPAVKVGNVASAMRSVASRDEDNPTEKCDDVVLFEEDNDITREDTGDNQDDVSLIDGFNVRENSEEGHNDGAHGKEDEHNTAGTDGEDKVQKETAEGCKDESSSSRSRQKRRNGKLKSPIPVVVVKGRGRSSSEDETVPKSSERKLHSAKAKMYPTAFNVAKRMEAKKYKTSPNQSLQHIKMKVFGTKGYSFGKKSSLHRITPSRCTDPLTGAPKKKNLSATLSASSLKKRRLTQPRFSSSSPSENHASGFETYGDDDLEVVQDSLPIEDSPKVSRRRKSDEGRRLIKLTEDRLVVSDPEIRGKHNVSSKKKATQPPKRLFKSYCKSGPITRSNLSKVKYGTSSESSSGTDWPGPFGEPGPKSQLNRIPNRLKPQKPTRVRPKANNSSAKPQKTSISPELSAITEETSPGNLVLDHDETVGLTEDGNIIVTDATAVDPLSLLKDCLGKLDRHSKNAEVKNSDDGRREQDIDVKQGEEKDLTDEEQNTPNQPSNSDDGNSHSSSRLQSKKTGKKESHVEQKGKEKNQRTRKGIRDNNRLDNYKTDQYPESNLDRAEVTECSSGLDEKEDDSVRVEKLIRYYDKVDKRSTKGDTVTRGQVMRKEEVISDKKATRKRSWVNGNISEDIPVKVPCSEENALPGTDVLPDAGRLTQRENRGVNRRRKADMSWKSYPSNKQVLTNIISREQGTVAKETESSKGKKNDYFSGDDIGYEYGFVEDSIADGYGEKWKENVFHDVIQTSGRKNKKQQSRKSSVPAARRRMKEISRENEETVEILQLQKICQDIAAEPGCRSTPIITLTVPEQNKAPSIQNNEERGKRLTPGRPIRTQRQQKSVRGRSTLHSRDQANHQDEVDAEDSNEDEMGEAEHPSSPFYATDLSRRLTTNERFGRLQDDLLSTKFATPGRNRARLDDSGIGITPYTTESSSRPCSSLSIGEGRSVISKPKGRRMGALQVTTYTKTPVTPRTSAIMRRIDEEEEEKDDNGALIKKRFVDWTSSGPSRPEQKRLGREEDITDDEDESKEEEDKGKTPKEKFKKIHNPHVRPRQLFGDDAQVSTVRGRAEEVDQMGYESGAEDVDISREMNDMITGLGGNLVKAIRRKRSHLQRFSQLTFERTIEGMNRYWEREQSHRDKLVSAFRREFHTEVAGLEKEMVKNQKTEELFLARLQQHAKSLSTQRIIQENKIKALQDLCSGFEREIAQDVKSKTEQQVSFRDKLRDDVSQLQKRFLTEMQTQDRVNLRRSLESLLDATVM